MEEIWKDVIGYEGLYQVSNHGRVKSVNYKRMKQSKLLSQCVTNSPSGNKGIKKNTVYYKCKIKSKEALVHRLVANAFIANPDNKPEVNHIDGNPLNNMVNNLEWATRSENVLHAHRTGLAKAPRLYGEKHGRCKLTTVQVSEIKELRSTGKTYKEIATLYNCHLSNVAHICSGSTRKNG